MKIDITPDLIINARKEQTYCDGCKYIGDGLHGDKICYRIIARTTKVGSVNRFTSDISFYKCIYANRNNECKFYKAKKINKRKNYFFLENFFRAAGIVVIMMFIIRFVWWLFSWIIK